jgi:hypothetical protein
VPQPEINVRVLETGEIRVDGHEVSLDELAAALDAARLDGSVVHYSHDNPDLQKPPEVDPIMRMITQRRLRVSLDALPRTAPAAEEKPESNVIQFPGIEMLFAKVRKHAAANRGVSLLRQDQKVYVLPAPLPGSINPQMEAGIKATVPSEQPRNIAAIAAPGALSGGDATKPPTVQDISRQVPFFGFLVGLAYVGHAVWIFEASAAWMPAGCEDADLLVMDSHAVSALPQGWATDAGTIMRNPNILVFDRTRQKMGALRTAGEVPGRIEFPN